MFIKEKDRTFGACVEGAFDEGVSGTLAVCFGNSQGSGDF